MTRKFIVIATISLLTIAFLATLASAKSSPETGNFFKKRGEIIKNVKYKFAGAEAGPVYSTISNESAGNDHSLGYDDLVSLSPGLFVGTSTYDLQSNCRQNRQIDWRGTQTMHIIWMRAEDSVTFNDGLRRGTGYEAWDTDEGAFVFAGPNGGCDVHPRLNGTVVNYSGYVGLDVDTEGKAVIGNHHREGANYHTTVWYDFTAAACFFSPYKRAVPDSVQQYGLEDEPYYDDGDWRMIWPQIEYQVYNGDTITHAVSMQWETANPTIDPSAFSYFRRVGSDTLGQWDYPPMVLDWCPAISQCVTASRVSGKVAILWQACPGEFPGDTISHDREGLDPGLGVNQRINDIFYKISNDMGASWGDRVNLTAYDSTQGGWLGHGEMSVLIDSDDYLHVLWPAREITPMDPAVGGLGNYTNFWGSRLLHWDEYNDAIRPVKDANWPLPDSACVGGAWNEMSIVKCMISECDNKFYATFVQFNDINNGIANDCHAGRFDGTYSVNTANGEIYISVSNDGGFSWDIARNLTNTYTPYCYENDDLGLPVCESDHYPAVSRFGQQLGDADFSGATVIDPSGDYAGDWYLDVFYLNDKFPGACMQDDGIWTINPYKWFRVPCVEPIPNPVLVYSPSIINQPTWTKPSIQLDTTVLLENVGNADLTIAAITTGEVNGPSGWLGVGTGGPLVLGYASGSTYDLTVNLNDGGVVTDQPHVLEGFVIFESDAIGGSVDSLPITLIVADTVQAPEWVDIRTSCKRMIFSNHGNVGQSGVGSYNLDYIGFDTTDCDTTQNTQSYDTGDNAAVYLYDASPFVLRVDSEDDTLFSHALFGINWFDEEAFIPQVGVTADSTTYPDYQYGHSGMFYSTDSLIAMEVFYYAPTAMENCEFVVVKQKVYNNTEDKIEDIFIGDIMDWDIPSDTAVRNQSGYDDDPDIQMMYTIGYDYGTLDTLVNNDCIADDGRVGGLAYYSGYRDPFCDPSNVADSIYAPRAHWTHINPDWVTNNSFDASALYEKALNTTGYETWEATADPTNPDSVAQDLHQIIVFGQYDLKPEDTLVFVKILATEYDGGVTALTQTVQQARTWIAAHPQIFAYPDPPDQTECGCCDLAGDANNNGSVNILDITFEISYLYKGGPAPECNDEADANGNGTVNILDITYLISYLYKGGPAPVCGETGSK
jgi:hypothetical protein